MCAERRRDWRAPSNTGWTADRITADLNDRLPKPTIAYAREKGG